MPQDHRTVAPQGSLAEIRSCFPKKSVKVRQNALADQQSLSKYRSPRQMVFGLQRGQDVRDQHGRRVGFERRSLIEKGPSPICDAAFKYSILVAAYPVDQRPQLIVSHRKVRRSKDVQV